MVMRNRPEDVLARIKTGAVREEGDWEVICEALQHQVARPVYMLLGCEWSIGSRQYPNWIGYAHIYRLLSHPGEQIHVCEMTHRPNLENARKSTQKSVRRVMDTLFASQLEIGEHLQAHITTGTLCTYTGDWDWQLSA